MPAAAPAGRAREIVIVGGGIMGLCTAFFVLESPDLPPGARVTLVERAAVAFGASGCAGGFISLSPAFHRVQNKDLARLARADWDMLVDKFDGEESFGFRNVEMVTQFVSLEDLDAAGDGSTAPTTATAAAAQENAQPWPQWSNGEVVRLPDFHAAMIVPKLFCSRIYQYCAQRGLRTLIATPTGRTDKVIHTSVGEDVPYDVLAITAGPWCNDVCVALGLPLIAVTGAPGHYVEMTPGYIPGGRHEVPPQALFTGIGHTLDEAHSNLSKLGNYGWFSPALSDAERRRGLAPVLQVFPCSRDKVYVVGENHRPAAWERNRDRKMGMPVNPREVPEMEDFELINRITRTVKYISPALDIDSGARIIRSGFAYRPIGPDGVPEVGRLADSVFVCAGHGPFGIALAPASGHVMSEFMLAALSGSEPKLSADISDLLPGRFSHEEISKFLAPTSDSPSRNTQEKR